MKHGWSPTDADDCEALKPRAAAAPRRWSSAAHANVPYWDFRGRGPGESGEDALFSVLSRLCDELARTPDLWATLVTRVPGLAEFRAQDVEERTREAEGCRLELQRVEDAERAELARLREKYGVG